LARTLMEAAGRSFAASRRSGRTRWLRVLLAELHGLDGWHHQCHTPALPADVAALPRGRLAPFRGGKNASRPEPGSGVPGHTLAWQPEEHMLLLYGRFLVGILASLPLTASEIEIVVEACNRFLELQAASAMSLCEHDVDGSLDGSTLAICVAAVLSHAFVHATTVETGSSRVHALENHLEALVPSLLASVRSGKGAVAQWLEETLHDGRGLPLKRKRRAVWTQSCKKRRQAAAMSPTRRCGQVQSETPLKRPPPQASLEQSAEKVARLESCQ